MALQTTLINSTLLRSIIIILFQYIWSDGSALAGITLDNLQPKRTFGPPSPFPLYKLNGEENVRLDHLMWLNW
jgi:hypothetical protein